MVSILASSHQSWSATLSRTQTPCLHDPRSMASLHYTIAVLYWDLTRETAQSPLLRWPATCRWYLSDDIQPAKYDFIFSCSSLDWKHFTIKYIFLTRHRLPGVFYRVLDERETRSAKNAGEKEKTRGKKVLKQVLKVPIIDRRRC